jgi:hypothetical protein
MRGANGFSPLSRISYFRRTGMTTRAPCYPRLLVWVTIDGRAWGLTHSHKIGIVLEKLVLAPTNILAALPKAFDNPVALRVINDPG